MATSKIQVTEGSGKNIATHSITEDSVTKEIQRVVPSDSTGAEIVPATQATLAAVLAKIIAAPSTEATLASVLAKIISAPSTEAKQDTLIAKDFATQTTLAAILAKIIASPATEATLNSILTKLNASVAVTGTFFQATQPISAASLPLPTGAATETTVNSLLKPASSLAAVTDITNPVKIERANLKVTATAATGVAATATLAAVASQFHNIAYIEITAYSTAARTGSATPILVTTTNLGNLVFNFATAAAIGTTDKQIIIPTFLLKSDTVNTASTIVCPATTGIIWRINVFYNTTI